MRAEGRWRTKAGWEAGWEAGREAGWEAAGEGGSVGELGPGPRPVGAAFVQEGLRRCAQLRGREAARSREDTLSHQAGAAEAGRQAALAQRDAGLSAAREERVSGFMRQAMRRMMHRDLSVCFGAWAHAWAKAVEAKRWKVKEEEHTARTHALEGEVEQAKAKEAQLAASLQAQAEEARRAVEQISGQASAEQEAMRAAAAQQEARMAEREAALTQEQGAALASAQGELVALRASVESGQQEVRTMAEAHAAEMEALREAHTAELAAQRETLDEQVSALREALDGQVKDREAWEACVASEREAELAEKAEAARQEKAELCMRASIRRMQYRDLSLGFNSWVEMWKAKTHAHTRMREIANRLHPATAMLASAFYFWAEESSEAGQAARFQSLERQQAKLQMLLAIRNKEIARLKVVITKLLPPDKAGAAARNRLDKQRRAAEKREGAGTSSSPTRSGPS